MNQSIKPVLNGHVDDGGSRDKRDGIRLDNTVITPTLDNRHKAIVSGKLVELYAFEKTLLLNRKTRKRYPSLFTVRTEEYRDRTAYRGSFLIRRLLYCSFEKYSKFISLTFNNENKFDITNLKVCNIYKAKFLARLKRSLKKDLKYIIVPEFQKRGAVHYHIICNLPYVDKEKIAKLWPHGFLDVRAIPNVDKQAYYLSKYISKNRSDPRFKGNKTYFTSRGLDKPSILYAEAIAPVVAQIKLHKLKVTRKGSFESKFNGTTRYFEYLLPKKGVR